MAQPPLSPSSSPRLPSPPPFPEVQISPKLPSPGPLGEESPLDGATGGGSAEDQKRRIRPGTKAADMAVGPELVPLAELDSSFQLQEYLRSLYLSVTRSKEDEAVQPMTREMAEAIARAPHGVDRTLWLYELCRLLVQRANSLIVGFFADTPPCSAAACPEMRASEWQYLCAVHDPPKSCCAIDYCCHTLDWAANVLTSQKHFPSRLALGSDAPGSSQQSMRQLTNIFRRVYRMFAHAWFQHRDVFWSLESQEGLYIFYKTVCDVYQLIPEENYTVPPEAEGAAPADPPSVKIETDPDSPLSAVERAGSASPEKSPSGDADSATTAQTTLSTGATTRRHKHTPSTGSFVTTIAEGDEEGDGSQEAKSPSLLSTVRRDRSSSPTKLTRTVAPAPVAESSEESEVQDTGDMLSEKVKEMSIQGDAPEPQKKEEEEEEEEEEEDEAATETQEPATENTTAAE